MPAADVSKKKLTGTDRLWQEWKRRHPKGDRQDFAAFVAFHPGAKKAIVEGKGKFKYGGYTFTKAGATKTPGPGGERRRAAGAASGITPGAYSSSKDTGAALLTPSRFDPAMSRMAERQIRAYFQARGSPLAKYAYLFITAGEISGFDPRFLAAIAVWETGAGTAIAYPETRPYNFWNWNNTNSGAVGADAPWQSVESAFKYYGQQFGQKYTGSNLFQDFGPYATDPSWEAKIGGTLRQIGGNPLNVRWGAPKG